MGRFLLRQRLGDLLRRGVYRMRYGKFGYLGHNVKISRQAQIENPANIRIGSNTLICEYCLLRVSATGHLVIGDNCYIGRMTEILDAGGFVEIGDRVQLGGSNFITGQGGLRIGDDSLIAPSVSIIANQHTFADLNTPIRDQPCVSAGITIGRNGWMGVGVTILDGVNIGDHVVVAANAVVTKDVPAYAVAAGVPAKTIRNLK